MTDNNRVGASVVSLGAAARVWLEIGLLGFGGPAGQIALMHRRLVEDKRWIDEPRFLNALNFCMLLPGPEAQQLATYAGWLLHGPRGGLIAGTLFILPGALLVLGLTIAYVVFANLGPVAGAFLGVKAAVLALVVDAFRRIGGRMVSSPAGIIIAALSFLAIFALHLPFPLIIAAAAIAGMLLPAPLGVALPAPVVPVPAPPGLAASLRTAALGLSLWLCPVAVLWLFLGPDHLFTELGAFFAKLAVVTFGGAYAILAYVAQEAVNARDWLTASQMVDGLGLAETTPGPLILVLEYVGFIAAYRAPGALDPLVAGLFGALLTLWVTFVPSFLWIFLGAPYVERLLANRALAAALKGVTAAVVGVILNLALWFALHVLFGEVTRWEGMGLALDVPTLASVNPAALALTALAFVLLFGLRWGPAASVVALALAGLALSLVAP